MTAKNTFSFVRKMGTSLAVLFLAAACNRVSVNYGTQAACEKATGLSCYLELCDIPPCPESSNQGWLPVSTNQTPDKPVLGEEVTLKKGESVSFKDTDVSLKVTDFYYHPCSPGQECFWSGLDVYFELTVGNKTYTKNQTGTNVGDWPYTVAVKNSDYKTYATFVVVENRNQLNSYTSSDYGFSIKYPNDFKRSDYFNETLSLSYIPICDQAMIVCFFLPRDKYPGTNFDGAGISIYINGALNTRAKCYNFKDPTSAAQNQGPDISINGVVFKSATGGGAAAGHSEQAQVYRNFRNNSCYEISAHVAQTSLANYPEGTVSEFDSGPVWRRLQDVVNTFELTR